MLKSSQFFVIGLIIILPLMIGSVIKHARFKDVDPEIKKLMYSSLDIQYNRFSHINPRHIFFNEVLEKDKEHTYKYDKWPYIILLMDEYKRDMDLYVRMRILDRKGEYIQECHLIKKEGRYLIKDIEYDI
jgi:hypothetical protein